MCWLKQLSPRVVGITAAVITVTVTAVVPGRSALAALAHAAAPRRGN